MIDLTKRLIRTRKESAIEEGEVDSGDEKDGNPIQKIKGDEVIVVRGGKDL